MQGTSNRFQDLHIARIAHTNGVIVAILRKWQAFAGTSSAERIATVPAVMLAIEEGKILFAAQAKFAGQEHWLGQQPLI